MDDYFDLGSFRYGISTNSSNAKIWFDRGLNWSFAFNFEEAIKCFRKAAQFDPNCAMAHWGIAYASGPNVNRPWSLFDDTELRYALTRSHIAARRAMSLIDSVSDVEQSLIRAVRERCVSPQPFADMADWDSGYAHAMQKVYDSHPDDIVVCALFAEALINLTPWTLWDRDTGEPADNARTLEVLEVLENAIRLNEENSGPRHPGLLHLYIHVLSISPTPERALPIADRLRNLAPDASRFQHAPTQIDLLCGHYNNVIVWNSAAIAADQRYVERRPDPGFYVLNRCHNYYAKLCGAMHLAHSGEAMSSATGLADLLSIELLETPSPPMADWLEGFASIKSLVLIRFGMWEDIIDAALPEDQELYCVTTAAWHYAKGIAYSVIGDTDMADDQKRLFLSALDRVPDTRRIFNNRCHDLLAIASELLLGELEYRKRNLETAFAHLYNAVGLDDTLPDGEPWGWPSPVRHTLGGLLLEQDRLDEAEAVYREDLGYVRTVNRARQHPDNVWSLHGLHECLRKQGKHDLADMAKRRLDVVSARADIKVKASCFTRARLFK